MEYKVYSSTEHELVAPITARLCEDEFACIGDELRLRLLRHYVVGCDLSGLQI